MEILNSELDILIIILAIFSFIAFIISSTCLFVELKKRYQFKSNKD